jgi:hypothetical protein
MKSMISKTMMLVAISATLFSFSPKPGGEGFEISMNNKVLIQRFGTDINTLNSLPLTQAATNDQLIIKYYHCGKVGKNRMITIKDGQNNVLKEFHYADGQSTQSAMSLPVKNILELKKSNTGLKLYYSSSELPNGRLLTSIILGNTVAAQP